MVSTVSRRLVYVKMKRKPAPRPQPFAPSRNRGDLNGDDAWQSRSAVVALKPAAPASRMSIWTVAGWSLGGLCGMVGIVAALVSFSGSSKSVDEDAPNLPSTSVSTTYGQSIGGGNSAANDSPAYARPRISQAQAFLNAPFQKHR